MLDAALTLCEGVFAAENAREASLALFSRAGSFGAVSLQSRLYYRPTQRLTNATHWAAGGFIVREAPAGWVGSPGFRYICFEQNPLLNSIRQNLTRYRFSDFAPFADRAYNTYWEAFTEGGIADGLCATAYGSERRIGSVHLGIGERTLDPDHEQALWLATTILAERLMSFTPEQATPPPPVTLSTRERDALAFVADGKTDWEIATILGIAESTARFHVDNARRKLDAANRAHAVAKFLALYGPI